MNNQNPPLGPSDFLSEIASIADTIPSHSPLLAEPSKTSKDLQANSNLSNVDSLHDESLLQLLNEFDKTNSLLIPHLSSSSTIYSSLSESKIQKSLFPSLLAPSSPKQSTASLSTRKDFPSKAETSGSSAKSRSKQKRLSRSKQVLELSGKSGRSHSKIHKHSSNYFAILPLNPPPESSLSRSFSKLSANGRPVRKAAINAMSKFSTIANEESDYEISLAKSVSAEIKSSRVKRPRKSSIICKSDDNLSDYESRGNTRIDHPSTKRRNGTSVRQLQRLERNKEAARSFRNRQKNYLKQLESKYLQLKETKLQLALEVQSLQTTLGIDDDSLQDLVDVSTYSS